MGRPATDLATLVQELRRTKSLLAPEELAHRAPTPAPTGLPPLDRLLGGGLPEGRMVELAATAQGRRPGAAATAVVHAVLARCTEGGRLAALVDRGDGFDPRSAREAGVELERLLWCRPGSVRDAIKAADVLLASGAFALVVLDLRQAAGRSPKGEANKEARFFARSAVRQSGPRSRRADCWTRLEAPPSTSSWVRLGRDAEAARARLLVLGGSGAQPFCAASLEVTRSRARFAGQGRGRTFEGLEVELALVHNRLGLPPAEARLSFRAPAHFPEPAPEPPPRRAAPRRRTRGKT